MQVPHTKLPTTNNKQQLLQLMSKRSQSQPNLSKVVARKNPTSFLPNILKVDLNQLPSDEEEDDVTFSSRTVGRTLDSGSLSNRVSLLEENMLQNQRSIHKLSAKIQHTIDNPVYSPHHQLQTPNSKAQLEYKQRITDINDKMFRLNERWKKKWRQQKELVLTLNAHWTQQVDLLLGQVMTRGNEVKQSAVVVPEQRPTRASVEEPDAVAEYPATVYQSVDYMSYVNEQQEQMNKQQEQINGIITTVSSHHTRIQSIENENIKELRQMIMKQQEQINHLTHSIHQQKTYIETLEKKTEITTDHNQVLSDSIKLTSVQSSALEAQQELLEHINDRVTQVSEITDEHYIHFETQSVLHQVSVQHQIEQLKANMAELTSNNPSSTDSIPSSFIEQYERDIEQIKSSAREEAMVLVQKLNHSINSRESEIERTVQRIDKQVKNIYNELNIHAQDAMNRTLIHLFVTDVIASIAQHEESENNPPVTQSVVAPTQQYNDTNSSDIYKQLDTMNRSNRKTLQFLIQQMRTLRQQVSDEIASVQGDIVFGFSNDLAWFLEELLKLKHNTEQNTNNLDEIRKNIQPIIQQQLDQKLIPSLPNEPVDEQIHQLVNELISSAIDIGDNPHIELIELNS
jgi:hypothetical protein